MSAARRGFTLIEALASAVLLGVGIAAVMGGLGAMRQAETRLNEREVRLRLATQQLEELLATNDFASPTLDGDFSDRNLPDFRWTAELGASGIENLDRLVVTVTKDGETGDAAQTRVETLRFRPPETGGTQP